MAGNCGLSDHCLRGARWRHSASWWWVVAIALLLSLMRWDSLSERAKEVSEERHRSGRRPRLVEAYVAVLFASFLMHFFLCALAYFLGRGLAWIFWEVKPANREVCYG